MVTITRGIMCTLCLDLLTSHGDQCSCGNLAILFDEDTHTHIYVDDILTARQATVFMAPNALNVLTEVARELEPSFSGAIYTDYRSVLTTPLTYSDTFTPEVQSSDFQRALMYSLRRYQHSTSDGNERFYPTALNDSKVKPTKDDL